MSAEHREASVGVEGVLGMLSGVVLVSSLGAGTVVAYLSLTGSVLGLMGVVYATRKKSPTSAPPPEPSNPDDRLVSLERSYQSLGEKVSVLQDQVDTHRRKLGRVADQLSELYGELDGLRRQINMRRSGRWGEPQHSSDDTDPTDDDTRSQR